MDKNPDVYGTSLALGLGYAGPSTDRYRGRNLSFKREPSVPNLSPLQPSLTLSLPEDAYGSTPVKANVSKASSEANLARSSSPSTVSSFSKVWSDEAERVYSRVSDEEEEGNARKKLRLTKEQSALLEDRFKEHSTLNPKQKQALAKQLNLRPRQVEVWFQNRRARTKMKQTEVDCEILRRCYETLTDENQKLHKELRELKALQLGSPWYMQFPGATLTVCPSCERITGACDGSKGGPYAAAPKPQLFNPFNRSAAC